MAPHGVRHDWSDLAAAAAACWGSLQSPWFCLVATKIWSKGGAVLWPRVISLDRPVLQLHVTAQFCLEHKGKHILTQRQEKPLAQFWLLFLYVFLLPLSLPYGNWASQESCLSPWGPHSGPHTFLCSIFAGFSLPCLLATAILDSFFLF